MDKSTVALPSGDSPFEQVREEFLQRLDATGNCSMCSFVSRVPPEQRAVLLRVLVNAAIKQMADRQSCDPEQEIRDQNSAIQKEINDALESVFRTADFIANPTGSDAPPSPPRKSKGLHIRCPHCSNPVELVVDTPNETVDCSACGSTFSLIDKGEDTRAAQALRQIDRFALLSRIGVGGFGTVWKARDTRLDRVVALKIPREGQLSDYELEKFFREARAAAQLHHPNIVPVHEVGRDGDTIFIVSEFIRGVDLSDWLTAQPVLPKEAAKLMAKVAGALHHAHEKGIIHRDLKPANVMLDDHGEPRLMDFGLAKRESDEVAMTMDGQILGTPAYMSPEQASGESAWVDRRSDIYSLGVMLFELLTGERPFRGNMQMQLHQRQVEDAPNARSLATSVPLDLATICAKCLEREPGRRYATSLQVAEELQRFLAGEPIVARPLSPIERTGRWIRRKPVLASLIGLMLFLAIAGPAAAMVIEGQRRQLAIEIAENNNLIRNAKTAENQRIVEKSSLEKQVALLSGAANPWESVAAGTSRSPRLMLAGDFLITSGDHLKQISTGSTACELDRIYSDLALALLSLAAEDQETAETHLSGVIPRLQEDVDDLSPLDRVAFLDCAAAALAKLEVAADGLDLDSLALDCRRLRKQLVKDNADDPIQHILLFEAELRCAAAVGADDAVRHLATARQIKTQLAGLWPQEPKEAYRLANFLWATDNVSD